MFARLSVAALCTALQILSPSWADEPTAGDKPADQAESPNRPATKKPSPRKPPKKTAAQEKKEAARTKWLERLKERGVDPWPEKESDEEHADALKKTYEMAIEVVSLFPNSQLHETQHFLVVSDIPPQQIAPYIASLDRMYDFMCQLYGVPKKHKVWLGGKAPIFAFLGREEFEAFEERYFPEAKETIRALGNVYGLSHLSKTGEVTISCFRGNNPNDFGQMLVHETSHGFIHRYKTKAQLPNWVDEGMADLVGAEMVPASTAVRNREMKAIEQIAQQRSLGGMLKADRIEGWQYGAASNLNRFLLQSNRQNYVRFIEALKEGMKWDEALKDAYGATPDELLREYGRRINVRDLKP
jgi:hypothetical protein